MQNGQEAGQAESCSRETWDNLQKSLNLSRDRSRRYENRPWDDSSNEEDNKKRDVKTAIQTSLVQMLGSKHIKLNK